MKCPNCNKKCREAYYHPELVVCWNCREAYPNPNFKRTETPELDKLSIEEQIKALY